MRIASFNVENLFERARVMNQDDWAAGRPVLDKYAELNGLIAQPAYTAADKARMVVLLTDLGLANSDESTFVILRRNRGQLLKRPQGGGLQITANGRDDWIGWLDLKTEAVNEIATRNTARVIHDVNADVQVVVEAEHRVSLARFNDQLMPMVGGQPYDHVMLIDGNDERGIDVGLMTRAAFPIGLMRSHVDDMAGGSKLFSRDCPEFHLKLAGGETLVVLANHLKSKGYGSTNASNARRKAQARRVREIYQELRADGLDLIAIAGDFNDTPASDPLSPLLADGSDLQDISAHPNFDKAGRDGTWGNATAANKIDYILLSPALFARATGGGVWRKGAWGGVHGTLWPHYPEVTRAEQAASDHAAIYADIT